MQAALRQFGPLPDSHAIPAEAVITHSLYYTWRDNEMVRHFRWIYCCLIAGISCVGILVNLAAWVLGNETWDVFVLGSLGSIGAGAACFSPMGVPAIICEWMTRAKLARWERHARAAWPRERRIRSERW